MSEMFFDKYSEIGDKTRGEAVIDNIQYIAEYAEVLRGAVEAGDLDAAQEAFREMQGGLDAIDDVLFGDD